MVTIQYGGHSFFSIKSKDGTILIDPIFDNTKVRYKKKGKLPINESTLKDVSMILLTNDSVEHFDKSAVERIAKKNDAIVVANDFVLNQMQLSRNQKYSIDQKKSFMVKGFKINTTTAHYPHNFFSTGYLIETEGRTIYHAGLTQLLDSFSEIKTDLAILPLSEKSMDVVDVVRAAKMIKAKKLIPMQHELFDIKCGDPKDLTTRIKDSILETETINLCPGKKMKL